MLAVSHAAPPPSSRCHVEILQLAAPSKRTHTEAFADLLLARIHTSDPPRELKAVPVHACLELPPESCPKTPESCPKCKPKR